MVLNYDWERRIQSSEFKTILQHLYNEKNNVVFETHKKRYIKAVDKFVSMFGYQPMSLFSAPGRVELSGNHTDHQNGCVLAAAITRDIIAAVAPNNKEVINVFSEGHEKESVNLNNLEPQKDEINSATALIKGITAGFKKYGYLVGGFEAYTCSNVPVGSGLSSSAAFEVLTATILNNTYNSGKIDNVRIAQIGQFAENNYFNKPCGLMDQLASSTGGITAIDFEDNHTPKIDIIDKDFEEVGCALYITQTGGSHADMTNEYEAITKEMKSVANIFGKNTLRQVNPDVFFSRIGELRGRVSDRALLRAMHFFGENERVGEQVKALKSGNIERYKALMLDSGFSSAMKLENIYPLSSKEERSAALALAISQKVLEGKGAWRIHGGGFTGTILALVPKDLKDCYQNNMKKVFGAGNCYPISVRPVGGYEIPIG